MAIRQTVMFKWYSLKEKVPEIEKINKGNTIGISKQLLFLINGSLYNGFYTKEVATDDNEKDIIISSIELGNYNSFAINDHKFGNNPANKYIMNQGCIYDESFDKYDIMWTEIDLVDTFGEELETIDDFEKWTEKL